MAEWVKHGSGVTVTPNTSDLQAPNGSNTAIKFERGDAEGWMYRLDEINCEAGSDYTFSIFAKLDGVERVAIRIGNSLDDNYIECTYDLVNNTVVEGPIKKGDIVTTLNNVHLTSVGDLWHVLSLQIRFNDVAKLSLYVTTRDGNVSVKGDDSDGLDQIGYFWNPTIEKRSIDLEQSYLGSAYYGINATPEYTYFRLPLWGANTSSVRYGKSDYTSRVITPTSLNDFNTNTAVEYFRIPVDRKDGFPNEVTIQDTRGGIRKIKVERDDLYTKYDPILISFVNKQGVIEGLWFIRRSDYAIKTTSDSYYKNLINYDSMTYNTHDHSMKKYNVVSHKSAKLNTGYVPQEMNLYFEELKNSEQVWLTNSGGTVPVNMKDGSFRYKTHINDKLVQYEMEFDFANRLDNTIV